MICGAVLFGLAVMKYRELGSGLAQGSAVQIRDFSMPAGVVYGVLGGGALVGVLMIVFGLLSLRRKE